MLPLGHPRPVGPLHGSCASFLFRFGFILWRFCGCVIEVELTRISKERWARAPYEGRLLMAVKVKEIEPIDGIYD